MEMSRETHPEVIPTLTAAALFLSAAVSMACIFLTIWGMPSWDHPVEVAAAACPLVFVCACIVIAFRPRLGYCLGLVAGLIALPWLTQIEVADASWSSWVFFNSEGGIPLFARLKILSVTLIAIAVACSLIRLLPAGWSVRKSPLCRRTWPAFAVGFLVLAVWFVCSVTPYSVPAYDHPARMEFRILHVQKRGLQFRETMVMTRRNGQVWVFRDERHLFQYRFEGHVAVVSLGDTSPTSLVHARAFTQSPEFWKLHPVPAGALRSWNAEGWYVVLKDSRLLTFTSEYRTAPPQEVTGLFHEIEKLPAVEERPFAVRDACLGFCYDPIAALGFSVLQQRVRLLNLNSSGVVGGPSGTRK